MAKEKKSRIDKLIMGAIVGAAVGSVIGSAVAPDSGKKTRDKLKNKTAQIIDSVKSRKEDVLEVAENLVDQERKQKSLIRRIFGGSKKTKKNEQRK